MENTNRCMKYLRIMALGIVIDLVFYLAAHFGHLPLWMDTMGTSFAAMMLEPAAGLLVGFVANFYKASFIYGSSNMVAYSLSAAAALIVGLGMRKNGTIQLKRIFPVTGAFIMVNSFLGAIVAMWQGNVVSAWERHFMEIALAHGVPQFFSVWYGGFVLKLADGLALAIFLLLAYKITPKNWMNQETKQIVSFKNPFFVHKKG